MKYLPILIFTLFIFSCKNSEPKKGDKEEPTVNNPLDFTIEPGVRFGIITSENCSPEGVLKAYGDLARRDSVYLGEGIWEQGVVLFADDQRKRVEIFWDSLMSKKYPALMRTEGDSTGSDWKTTDGVTIGLSIEEVQKLNGNPFSLFGFGWDYGGYVTDFENGSFENSLGLRFFPTKGVGAQEIAGERIISSSNPAVVESAPKVFVMEARIKAREALPDCLKEKVGAIEKKFLIVEKTTVNGADHYWFNDGAAAYDGMEMIYDENCEEICQIGGMRPPSECSKIYADVKWELVWEK